MAARRVVGYAETVAIQAFLGYLHTHYSKLINPKDTYLIAAVASWFYQESGSLRNVIGNNPFNIRVSPLQSGTRLSRNGNGHFAIFPSLSVGFEAAAYLLMHGNRAYGYQLALNALKHSGNQAAVDFLAALAMSSWDAAHYGATDWLSAYNPATNHLLRVYTSIKGIQVSNPHPPPPKPPPAPHAMPKQPRDTVYQLTVKSYLDPYAAGKLYARRRGRMSNPVDGTTLKR